MHWGSFKQLAKMPTPELAEWLTDPGSFMQRLAAHGLVQAKVSVIKEGYQMPTSEERQILNIPERQYALIREVLIGSNGNIWMFARTVIPLKTLTGKEQQYARLKNRPLGSKLFKDPSMVRENFDFVYLKQEGKDTWGRRSLFYVKQKPLLLAEIFLPDLIKVISC